MRKLGFLSAVLLELVLVAACGSGTDITKTDATETNFTRLACFSDAECLPGEVCEFAADTNAADAGLELGHCVLTLQ